MLQKWIAVCLVLAGVLGMAACGGSVAPLSTQVPAAETTDVCACNGHAWVEAACAAPRTCTVCALTEGVPAGHTWMEATYQAAKTCSVCAATEGEALVAYFTQVGLEERLLTKAGQYQYTLDCYEDTTKTTVAKVFVEDYMTISSDETHEALDGYEWKVLSLRLHFSDENAARYSIQLGGYFWADRYEAEISEEKEDEENEDGIVEDLFTTGLQQTIRWNGVEYDGSRLHVTESLTEWMKDESGNYYIDFYVTVSARVPVGFDGFIFGLEDAAWSWTEGKYLHEVITDNSLLFCLD